jgi:hypothetical protein
VRPWLPGRGRSQCSAASYATASRRRAERRSIPSRSRESPVRVLEIKTALEDAKNQRRYPSFGKINHQISRSVELAATAIDRSRNPERLFGLGRGNRSSCPIADLAGSTVESGGKENLPASIQHSNAKDTIEASVDRDIILGWDSKRSVMGGTLKGSSGSKC